MKGGRKGLTKEVELKRKPKDNFFINKDIIKVIRRESKDDKESIIEIGGML